VDGGLHRRGVEHWRSAWRRLRTRKPTLAAIEQPELNPRDIATRPIGRLAHRHRGPDDLAEATDRGIADMAPMVAQRGSRTVFAPMRAAALAAFAAGVALSK